MAFTRNHGLTAGGAGTVATQSLGPTARIVSCRMYGQDAVATVKGHKICRMTGFISGSPVAETNTLSVGPLNNYGGGSNAGSLIILHFAQFSSAAWIPHPRLDLVAATSPGAESVGSVDFFGDGTPPFVVSNASFEETTNRPARVTRRTRAGTWMMYGNQIRHHQTSGGGSFNIRAPYFETDVAWIDASVWKNDTHAQSLLPLFDSPVEESLFTLSLMGVGK